MSAIKLFAALVMALAIAGRASATTQPELPGSGHTLTEQKRVPEAIMAKLNDGFEALKKNDFKSALDAFQSVAGSPDFSDLSPQIQYTTLIFLSVAEFRLGQNQAAYDHLIEAGKRSPELRDANYWFIMCDLSQRLHKPDIAVTALTNLAKDFPEKLRAVDARYMFSLIGQIKSLPDNRKSYAVVLQALWDAAYRPNDSLFTMDVLWFDLFEIRLAEGNKAVAQDILSKIDNSDVVIKLRVDRRYHDMVASDALHSDFQAAFDRGVERERILVATSPRRSEAVIFLASDLLKSNRLSEALERLDEVIEKVAKAPKDQPPYDDLDEQYNWVLDMRARVFSRQGRWKEVEAIMTKARDYALEHKEDVVSQKINLGDFYYEQGRPDAALIEVKDVSAARSSPYGVMAAEEVRACAYAQLGDQAKLKTSLDYMRAHADDGYGPLRSALLCAGDIDGLATMIVAKLDDPATRNRTLVDLQIYLPETNVGLFSKIMNANREKVLARPEVQAAIAKYGFRESYPVFADGN